MTKDIATAALNRGNRTRGPRGQWLAPTGLILLALIPVLAGAARLTELTGGAVASPQNARFLDSPVPVVTHIVSVTVYSLLGAFQFVPALRRRRAAGIASPDASSSPPACSPRSPVCGWRSSTRTRPETARSFWCFGWSSGARWWPVSGSGFAGLCAGTSSGTARG